jgi:hypothetical protein
MSLFNMQKNSKAELCAQHLRVYVCMCVCVCVCALGCLDISVKAYLLTALVVVITCVAYRGRTPKGSRRRCSALPFRAGA